MSHTANIPECNTRIRSVADILFSDCGELMSTIKSEEVSVGSQEAMLVVGEQKGISCRYRIGRGGSGTVYEVITDNEIVLTQRLLDVEFTLKGGY